MRFVTAIGLTMMLSMSATSFAQDSKKLKPKEIGKILDGVLDKYAALFNKHDAKNLAEEYDEKPDVLYTDGVHITTRAEMEKSLSDYFAKNPNVQVVYKDVSRKILSQRIVVETGTWEESGHTEKGIPTKGQYACVMMLKKGKWLIVHDRAWVMPEKPSDK